MAAKRVGTQPTDRKHLKKIAELEQLLLQERGSAEHMKSHLEGKAHRAQAKVDQLMVENDKCRAEIERLSAQVDVAELDYEKITVELVGANQGEKKAKGELEAAQLLAKSAEDEAKSNREQVDSLEQTCDEQDDEILKMGEQIKRLELLNAQSHEVIVDLFLLAKGVGAKPQGDDSLEASIALFRLMFG